MPCGVYSVTASGLFVHRVPNNISNRAADGGRRIDSETIDYVLLLPTGEYYRFGNGLEKRVGNPLRNLYTICV